MVRVIMLSGIILIGDILIVILASGVLPNVFMLSLAILCAVLVYLYTSYFLLYVIMLSVMMPVKQYYEEYTMNN